MSLIALLYLYMLCCSVFAVSQANQKLTLISNLTIRLSDDSPIVGRIWELEKKQARLFLGIPYALAPTGERRFKKPVKTEPWSKNLLVMEPGPACIQFMSFAEDDQYSRASMASQSEDCLFLNVFSPYVENSGEKYPVVVWIHGGSYCAGSGDTGMQTETILKNIVSKGVVLVTLNYRLGVLGFTTNAKSVNTDYADVNVGLWDQVTVLQWIQRNIRSFGGNPGKVTIMGESAGASSVSLLAVSPYVKEKELVHSAIIMSGSALSSWGLHRQGTSSYDLKNIMQYLTCDLKLPRRNRTMEGNCPFNPLPLDCENDIEDLSEKELYKCFREKVKFERDDKEFWEHLSNRLGVSKPVIDGVLVAKNFSEAFGSFPRVRIMTGVAELEWAHKKPKHYDLHQKAEITMAEMKQTVHRIIEDTYVSFGHDDLEHDTVTLITDSVFFQYIEQRSADKPNGVWKMNDFVAVLQELQSDFEFVGPCVAEINAYSDRKQPVYLYSFNHLPKQKLNETRQVERTTFFGANLTEGLRITEERSFRKAFHGLDHAYIFAEGYSGGQRFQYDEDDHLVSQLFSTLITNFVKSGNPTPTPLEEFGDLDWPTYQTDEPNSLDISVDPTVNKNSFHHPGGIFWNRVVPSLSSYMLKPTEPPTPEPLTQDERVRMSAYKRAWWALWILVGAIAFLLWTVVICLVVSRCKADNKSTNGPYKTVVVRSD